MTNAKICPNGHYYDGNRYSECPYCKPNVTPSNDVSETQGLETKDLYTNNDPIKTISLDELESGVKPVVGWLVCTDGPDKGRDYRLHSGNNYVGRNSSNDVAIRNDKTISGDRHFCVGYDDRHHKFHMFSCGGEAIVYLNDNAVTAAAQGVSRGDKIEVGKTALMFVPLCGEDFEWPEPEEKEEKK